MPFTWMTKFLGLDFQIPPRLRDTESPRYPSLQVVSRARNLAGRIEKNQSRWALFSFWLEKREIIKEARHLSSGYHSACNYAVNSGYNSCQTFTYADMISDFLRCFN